MNTKSLKALPNAKIRFIESMDALAVQSLTKNGRSVSLINLINFCPGSDIESPRRRRRLDFFGAGEIGDGAADFEDAAVSAGAQAELVDGHFE
jgi:hypothetical protein